VVECTGLENRKPARARGFESHPFRQAGAAARIHKEKAMKRLSTLVFLIFPLLVVLPSAAAAQGKRANADARHCLDLPTNGQIIKCAEKYR